MNIPSTQFSYETLFEAIVKKPLFLDKSWQLSPKPFPLTRKQVEQLQEMGQACLELLQTIELLYRKSSQKQPVLRNDENALMPWVSEYLNRGKPQRLIEHGLHQRIKNQMPAVIRPDLLVTENGFALTEIDGVPGGLGLTAFLNQFYKDNGFGTVIGEEGNLGMLDRFYNTICSLDLNNKQNPVIAIIVSDEAITYQPEFSWIAQELHKKGFNTVCVHPNEVQYDADNRPMVMVNGNLQTIDIVYRYFELFDLPNVPGAEKLMQAVEAHAIALTPPMKTYHEEKLNFALLHHHLLDSFFKENISASRLQLLNQSVPNSWMLDDITLPPGAFLEGPQLQGRWMHDWRELGKASQKERQYIIKISGFNELAWGSRSVTLGSDVSTEAWVAALDNALSSAKQSPYVLQDYDKPMRLQHPIYDQDGNVTMKDVRVRLCPYYFVGKKYKTVELGGVLATLCPADKKVIHGMNDCALVPCMIEN